MLRILIISCAIAVCGGCCTDCNDNVAAPVLGPTTIHNDTQSSSEPEMFHFIPWWKE